MTEEANRKSIAAYTMVQPSTTPTPTLSPQTPHPQNFHIWNSHRHHAACDYCRQWTAAILSVIFSKIGSLSNNWASCYYEIHPFICYSLRPTFSSTAQPFIWFSCFSYLKLPKCRIPYCLTFCICSLKCSPHLDVI